MDQFFSFIDALPLPISDKEEIHRKLLTYQQSVEKYTARFNLISHNDLSIIWERHFRDAVIPIQLFPDYFVSCDTKQIIPMDTIDVGSGAGFPGVPLAVLLHPANVVLIESIKKKALFLEKLIEEFIVQTNCSVISERAELLAQGVGYREKFTLAFARALAKPPVALELVIPFVKVGGRALLWASGPEWDELDRLKKVAQTLGAVFKESKIYQLPQESRDRKIIVFEKTEPTNQKYPREIGIPAKRPLG